jgi:hypothetical protein
VLSCGVVGRLKSARLAADKEEMRKHVAVCLLLLLVCAAAGSSAFAHRSSVRSTRSGAVREEKRLGPKPTPHWYWRWADWQLGEGYAKGHRLQSGLRPRQAPPHIRRWAWRRLHFFLIARGSTGASSRPTSGETYRKAISYTRRRPPFAPTRTVGVSSDSELRSALSNLQPGDLVEATASFTVNGQTRISNRLSAPAELDLSGVSFVYSGGQDYNAVWLDNAQNLYIYGGDTSTSDTGGACISDYGSQHVLWWGFTAHDCGGDGFDAQAIGGPVDHNDFQGTIWKVGQNLAWDPHAEKGTGLHGANLWDANYSGNFTNNRFAFYAHDIPVGACVEFGNDQPSSQATGNTLYLKCLNETELSTTQTGGNALQIWGDTNTLGLDVKYLQADNLQGFACFDHGIYSGQTAQGITIEYGRATNTNQNPRYAGQSPWDSYGNVAYKRVRPAP